MKKAPQSAFIAFGGNLGDPVQTLIKALPMLQERVGGLGELSSLYETRALTLRGEVHPNYINAVMRLVSTKEPAAIMEALLGIEKALGRDRSPNKRWEPRTIDLDLLFVDDVALNTPLLTLPHPEVANRDFVVSPLAEIAPTFLHPVLKKTMKELEMALLGSDSERFVLRTFPFSAKNQPMLRF